MRRTTVVTSMSPSRTRQLISKMPCSGGSANAAWVRLEADIRLLDQALGRDGRHQCWLFARLYELLTSMAGPSGPVLGLHAHRPLLPELGKMGRKQIAAPRRSRTIRLRQVASSGGHRSIYGGSDADP